MLQESNEMISTGEFKRGVRRGKIRFAGNRKLGIYGMLRCASGKRMKAANRVFFSSEEEALRQGYRPCGICMREMYCKWKKGIISGPRQR